MSDIPNRADYPFVKHEEVEIFLRRAGDTNLVVHFDRLVDIADDNAREAEMKVNIAQLGKQVKLLEQMQAQGKT